MFWEALESKRRSLLSFTSASRRRQDSSHWVSCVPAQPRPAHGSGSWSPQQLTAGGHHHPSSEIWKPRLKAPRAHVSRMRKLAAENSAPLLSPKWPTVSALLGVEPWAALPPSGVAPGMTGRLCVLVCNWQPKRGFPRKGLASAVKGIWVSASPAGSLALLHSPVLLILPGFF